MDISLDEFIRRRKAETGFSLMDNKKNKPEIDKDKLDAELDLMASGGSNTGQESNKDYRPALSKFERIKIQDSSIDDDEEMPSQNSALHFAKEIEKLDHANCCNAHEDKMKPKSQQWRLGGNYKAQNSGYNRGRVWRNYRNDNVVRGNFTYNLRNDSGIRGIVRNIRAPRVVHSEPTSDGNSLFIRKVVRTPDSQKPIQVNISLAELGIGPFAHYQPPAPVPQIAQPRATAQVNMMLSTDDLLSYFEAKKEQQKAAAAKVFENDPSGNLRMDIL